jgi:hypothetical protein
MYLCKKTYPQKNFCYLLKISLKLSLNRLKTPQADAVRSNFNPTLYRDAVEEYPQEKHLRAPHHE